MIPANRLFSTKDDNQPHRLSRAQTEARLTELSTKAQAAWQKGLALSRSPEEKAEAFYVQGWGIRVLREYLFATDKTGKSLGYFFCCPWGSVYTVIRPVTLGGVRLAPLQQFVFDVTAEGFNLGVPFRRQIKIGSFQPTDVFEYGDPNEEPDH